MANQLVDLLDHIPDFLYNIIVAVAAVLIGVILKLILSRIFKFYGKLSGYFLINTSVKHMQGVMWYFLPLLMLNLALPMMRLGPELKNPLDKTLEILFTIGFAIILIRIVRIAEEYVYYTYDLKEDIFKERKIRTQLQFLRKIIISLIIFIAAGIILLSFDSMRKIGAGLLTGVGVGGIIIGFAAQKSLANLLAGFQIAFTQPIRIDDLLVVEGESGRVEEITLTYVVLRIWDQRRLILPINYFIEKPFLNLTRNATEITGTVFLYLDYTIPADELRQELTRLLEESSLWDKREKALHITNTNEHGVELRALASAKNSADVFELRCYIREKLIEFVRKNYPHCLPKTRAEINTKIPYV